MNAPPLSCPKFKFQHSSHLGRGGSAGHTWPQISVTSSFEFFQFSIKPFDDFSNVSATNHSSLSQHAKKTITGSLKIGRCPSAALMLSSSPQEGPRVSCFPAAELLWPALMTQGCGLQHQFVPSSAPTAPPQLSLVFSLPHHPPGSLWSQHLAAISSTYQLSKARHLLQPLYSEINLKTPKIRFQGF